MVTTLNKSILEKLGPDPFEVRDVDVTRLRDDRSEILSGDEVAFVATARFRLSADGLTALQNTPLKENQLATGDIVFFVGQDAELRSDKVQIAEDEVSQWLIENFTFTFLLNGSPHAAFQPVGNVRLSPTPPDPTPGVVTKPLPWLTKLNTVALKDDYVDVDVRILPKEPADPPPLAKEKHTLSLYLHASAGTKDDPTKGVLMGTVSCTDEELGRGFALPLPFAKGGGALHLKLDFIDSKDMPPDAGGLMTAPERAPHTTPAKRVR